MKLFTIGPVEMFPETLEVSSRQLPYFRTKEFSEVMLENERMFKESVRAPLSAKTVFLTTSGTGAMEAAIINCFTEKDHLLIINGGNFGKRFSQICDIHKISYDEVHIPFGEDLKAEMLEEFNGKSYQALLVNIHETSTGKLYDINLLRNYCQKYGLYLVVDAISAYGADAIDFEQQDIDLLITSSHKALALSPGISIVEISEKIYRDRILMIPAKTMYLDFKSHICNLERGQTPFTPAVGILLELNQRLKSIQKYGMVNLQNEMREIALRFRKELHNRGFLIPSYTLSNALTPILFASNAKDMYQHLKEEYGLVVTPSGGEYEDILLRVGHLGNLCWGDYEELLLAMEAIRGTK